MNGSGWEKNVCERTVNSDGWHSYPTPIAYVLHMLTNRFLEFVSVLVCRHCYCIIQFRILYFSLSLYFTSSSTTYPFFSAPHLL